MILVKHSPTYSSATARDQPKGPTCDTASSLDVIRLSSQHSPGRLGFEVTSPNAIHTCSSPVLGKENISENSFSDGGSSLLDDALSAAMEAIAGTGHFGTDESYTIGLNVSPVPTTSQNPNLGSVERSGDACFRNTDSPHAFIEERTECDCETINEHKEEDGETCSTLNTMPITRDTINVKFKQTNSVASMLQASISSALQALPSVSTITNWRFFLRPIFEMALVERLWRLGELGSSSPQALILSIWFIVSRHFGVGCRNDHAKLMFGCLDIELDVDTGQRQLRFFRKFDGLFNELEDGTFSRDESCLPDQVVTAHPARPDRCPVRLFEAYCARRPSGVNYPNSPLYLQPERNIVLNSQLTETETVTPWYTSNGLGKNKIGSMLNLALQSVGMPINGQVSLPRLCDALATSALTPAGGALGIRLAELTASCKQSHNVALRGELESCADQIVRESATRGSPINNILTLLCSSKSISIKHLRNASKTNSLPSPSRNCQSAQVSSSGPIMSQEPVALLNPPLILPTDIEPQITTLDSSNTGHLKVSTNEATFASNETSWSSKHRLPLATLNSETQHLLTQMLQDTRRVAPDHVLRDSVNRSTQPVPRNSWPEVLVRRPSGVVDSTATHHPPTMVFIQSLPTTSHTNYQQGPMESRPSDSTTPTIQLDENLMAICKPLDPFPKSSHAALPNYTASSLTSLVPVTQQPALSNDELRIDLRKAGNSSARSVHLELLELLDVVLNVAKNTVSNSEQNSGASDVGDAYAPHQPPVGLITQILWRSRALDDRGPWILTFAMWWLMQHYFGIGSRAHHARLCWGHLRLVSNVRDPVTDELCEAIEYVGPPEFTTVKACALLEHHSESSAPVRRVYPSSGWAEAEMTIASALMTGSQLGHPRVRPLDTGPDVPPLQPRCGPNFVNLFKTFSQRRQQPSLLPEAPFYVRPLKSSPMILNCSSSVAWFSIGALGKNRIGALMRNIVSRVVRPSLSSIAATATMSAHKACLDAIRRTAMAVPSQEELDPTLNHNEHRRLLISKLSCILCLNMSPATVAHMSSETSQSKSSPLLQSNTNTDTQTTRPIHSPVDQPLPNPGLPLTMDVSPITSMKACLPHTVPSCNTLFSQPTQPIRFDSMNARTPFSFQSNACPTSNWVLLSADGSITQLVPSQPTLQQQLQVSASDGVLFVPAENENLLSCSTASFQNGMTETCFVPTSLLTKTDEQGVKSQQTTSYLTQINSGAPNPVSLLLLSTNANTQAGAVPLSSLFANTNDTSSVQPHHLYRPHAQVVAIGPNNTLSSMGSETNFNQGYALPAVLLGDQNLHVTVSTPSTQFAVPPASSGCTTRLTFPCSVATTASVRHNIPDTFPSLAYSRATVNFKQPSLIEDTSSLSPVVRTNAPYVQVVNLATTASPSPERKQVTQPVCTESAMYSECTSQVDATIDDLISLCSGHSRGEPEVHTVPSPSDDNTFSPDEYGSPHGVFPNTPSKHRAISSCEDANPQVPADLSALSAAPLQSTTFSGTKNTSSKLSTTASSDDRIDKSRDSSDYVKPLPPVSEMTVFSRPPEPRPDQLITLRKAIDSAKASQGGDFPYYVEQLFRKGILSAHRPWYLNFCAWFINSLVFEVENRTDHASLRWGDFKLHTTADGKTEYIYFVNRVNKRPYYLAASPPSPYNLGLDEKTTHLIGNESLFVYFLCPVAVFNAFRERRPTSCLQPISKFYLQPRSTEDIDAINKTVPTASHLWFTERPWGKNKLGSLFGEAAKMAGLPVICLRKSRVRMHTLDSDFVTATGVPKDDQPTHSSYRSINQSCSSSSLDDLITQSVCNSSSSLSSGDQPKAEVKRRRMYYPSM